MGERADEIEPMDPRAARDLGVSSEHGGTLGATPGEGDTGANSSDVTWGAATDTRGIDATGGYPGEVPGTAGNIAPEDEIAATRAQIEQTRSQMSETIDAIQEKLSPGHLAEQAKNTVKDATIGKATRMINNAGDAAGNAGETAKGFGSTVVETIRQNPVPAALAGLGLGWLFMSGRNQRTGSSGYRAFSYERPYGYNSQYDYGPTGGHDYGYSARYDGGQSAGAAFAQAADRARNVAGQAQDATGQMVSQAQDAAGQAVTQVQQTAEQVGHQARYQAQRTASGFQEMLEERPLAVAAGAVTLGLAIGLALPTTPQENQLMGEARDTFMEQAQQTVRETAQKVQSVAQEAVGSAKEEAGHQFSES